MQPFQAMRRGAQADRREDGKVGELTDAPRAVVLVGEAARDRDRVDALLSANVTVILLPSLETVHSLITSGDERHRNARSSPHAVAVGNLRVDLTERRVLLGQLEVAVSGRELAILATLCEEPGRARTFAELAEPGEGDWFGGTERVHSAIKRLRRKLARGGVEVTIESVRGYGFRLVRRSVDPPAPQGPAGGSGPLPEGVMPSQELSRPRNPVTRGRLKWRALDVIQSLWPIGILWRLGKELPVSLV